ncbi:hypothetical protein TwortDSMZ_164 [Staphylococcus phage Twort]|uniref:Uncharacterized protein n=2 Tax=Staphylococcus phage Twort (strain DSM 17442 / HER 48) TaxID=2908167 RepID=A0A6H0X5N2_BPTWO|nr:ORF043 [Staphylococcus phage Twort]AAX92338.1 ORF043 [Staphylococcus phage Twort]QIW89162.1 hypothetical protein TwortDSMZ_164 [Staphylococcus phage Twort]
MSEMFYEQDIKDLIRTKKHLFHKDEITSNIDDIKIFNEKVICQGKCRTDCLVLDRNGTVMGIEIKTERDSTQRLNKQLYYYSLVCKYVYVFCHDKHVPKVEKILKEHKHDHVGIISYINFRGKPTVGKYKQATPSPFRSPYHTLNILWKYSLLTMLRIIRDYTKYYNKKVTFNKNGHQNELATKSTQSYRMKKPAIINQIIGFIGVEKTYQLFCRVVIYGYSDRWKLIDETFFDVVKNGVIGIYEEER